MVVRTPEVTVPRSPRLSGKGQLIKISRVVLRPLSRRPIPRTCAQSEPAAAAHRYCKKGANREYHRYGFHCKRSGRLTRHQP